MKLPIGKDRRQGKEREVGEGGFHEIGLRERTLFHAL